MRWPWSRPRGAVEPPKAPAPTTPDDANLAAVCDRIGDSIALADDRIEKLLARLRAMEAGGQT